MGRRSRLSVLTSPPARETLLHAVDSSLRRGQARNLSPHTLRFYRTRLEAFTRYLERQGLELAPGEVTLAVVRGFLADERERVSAVTVEDSYVTLRALFRFLVDDEVLACNPMEKVERVRTPRKLVETFGEEQVAATRSPCRSSSATPLWT